VTPKKIRVCPKCGSSRIAEAKSSVSGWLIPSTYYCKEEGCGYSGTLYVEVEVEEMEMIQRVMNGDLETDE
jgi:hypothetical protein